jgi:hypothetical protein
MLHRATEGKLAKLSAIKRSLAFSKELVKGTEKSLATRANVPFLDNVAKYGGEKSEFE